MTRTISLQGLLWALFATSGCALAQTAATGAAAPPAAAPAAAAPLAPGAAPSCPALLNLSLPRLQDDAAQNLCQYAGRVLLVVNTASYCGYTPQYQGLERLYDRYRSRGFVVLGFPSNDFGQQEPGSNKQIADFCENTFGVRFPMFAKTRVTGSGANPVFSALARESGTPPKWNFHKYLVGRDGRVIASYPSTVDPLDRRLVQDLEKAL